MIEHFLNSLILKRKVLITALRLAKYNSEKGPKMCKMCKMSSETLKNVLVFENPGTPLIKKSHNMTRKTPVAGTGNCLTDIFHYILTMTQNVMYCTKHTLYLDPVQPREASQS